jgi:hypothetical protein
MRFMIMVRATATSESEARPDDIDPKVMAAIVDYHQELAAAGVLLDGNGLRPSREGWRIRYRAGAPSVVDGPFAEVKELIAGYTLIQAPSREAALAWSRRFPSPFGDEDCEVEVRQLYEAEDFQPGESIDKLREAGIGSAGAGKA